jgi:hypothetical protein
VLFYGCETWSLTLMEEHRLRVFENRVLRRIFGPKRDEVTGGCWKLHSEELHGLYSLRSIARVIKARRMRWAGHVARMGAARGAYNILVGRPEGRRPLGRVWVCGFDSFGSGWGQVRGLLWTRYWTFGFHKMRGISWIAERTLSFSRRTLLHGVS